MKKKFYDVGTFLYIRNQKRTTGLIVSSIVAAVAGLGAAGINAASQSSANAANMQLNEETMEEQKKLFHEANQFNHDEAKLAREFNSQEAQINREFQAGQLDKQLQLFSPASQVNKYLQAGLNPASLAGNINNGASFSIPSGNAAQGSPASAAGVPQLPVGHVNPVDYGQFSKALGEAVNTSLSMSHGIEDNKTKKTFNKYYDEMLQAGLNVSRQQARVLWNQYNEISNKIELTHKSIEKLVSDIGLQEKQGKFFDAQGDLISAQEIGQHIDNIFKSEHWNAIIKREQAEAGLTDLQAKWYTSFVKSQIAMNFGSAAYSSALKELTDVERVFKEKGMQSELDILKETRNYYEDSNKLLQIDLEVAGKTKGKRAEEEIKSLEWKNSIWMRGADFMARIMQPIAVGTGLYLGAKGFKGTAQPKGFTPYKGFNYVGQ